MTVLRVLAYNLNLGGTDRVDIICSVLEHVDADVIALTEADDESVVRTLAERLRMHHVWARGSGARHIATLSRFPIAGWAVYNTPPLTQAVLETRISLHPIPSRAPNPAGEDIAVYNVHFLPYLLLPFELRRWQAVGRLLDIIRHRKPGPHLILGDLNAIGPGDRVLQRNNPARMKRVMMLQFRLVFRLAIPRLLSAGYVDCYRRSQPTGDGFTWMTGNRTTRYDYILADPTFAATLRACRVVDDIAAVISASDHFPLLAEFDLGALRTSLRAP